MKARLTHLVDILPDEIEEYFEDFGLVPLPKINKKQKKSKVQKLDIDEEQK